MQPDQPVGEDPAVAQDEFALAPVDLGIPDVGEGTPCYGVAVVEGVPDGSNPKRQFAAGALTFAPTPFPLKWQEFEDEGHEGSSVVGRVDQIWRDGAMIRWTGTLMTTDPEAIEVTGQIGQNLGIGTSVMVDDITEADVEEVYPPAPPGPPAAAPVADLMDMMGEMPEPDLCIYHAGRIRTLTIVAEPAFVEATIHLGESPIVAPSGPAALTPGPAPDTAVVAAAVGPHSTATSDAAWDGPANEKRLPSPMPVDKARAFYAWIDDSAVSKGEIPKTGGRFGHHEVSADGTPGAANIKACQSGIGILNGGRGGTTIPSGDVQGVYNHLAAHLRDAQLEPPPLESSAGPTTVTASSYTITIPEVWPERWFREPSRDEFALTASAGAIQITAEGRLYGLLAPGGVDHRGYRGSGRRVTAPRGIDYSEFMNKPCLVASADGQVLRINAGNVTFDCGHASPIDPRRADPSWATQHYDNSCTVAARVCVGENAHGTWVAGALLHGIEPDAVERIMACALSGDWQGGRLKAALFVPVEGFPQPVRRSVRLRDDALVASSAPIEFQPPAPPLDLSDVFDLIASGIGRDEHSRWAEAQAMAGRTDAQRWAEALHMAGR